MEEVWEHLKKQKTPIIDNRSVPTHIKHTLTHIYCAAADRQWGEAEMLVLLQVMYTDLDFLTEFHMELQNFLFVSVSPRWLENQEGNTFTSET